jgi:hypothetical protein
MSLEKLESPEIGQITYLFPKKWSFISIDYVNIWYVSGKKKKQEIAHHLFQYEAHLEFLNFKIFLLLNLFIT